MKPDMLAKSARQTDRIRAKQLPRVRLVVLFCMIGLVNGLTISFGLPETRGCQNGRSFAAPISREGIGRLGAARTDHSDWRGPAAVALSVWPWIFSPTAETEPPEIEPVMAKAGQVAAGPVFYMVPTRGPFNTTRQKAAPLYLYHQSLLC